ncbi:MFS transporter [Aliikangiella marina]|uniref:MFS transporter n=1 Tax=Aliikangiella marina TaxID=1712262 RepID=A0A545T2V7_9GAMM|nr:MFS transporter [Aliikangiella marina]TQV71539.1 MFS transporter [Aliikangiella marina]
MTQHIHYETAPQDRIPFIHKVIYGFGAFVNNLLAAAIGGMVIVLNLGLGMNPALVGLLAALPRLTDAITDPIMGYISDHTRSRWGRRRPYIFVGAIVVAIVFVLLWQLPAGKSESYYFWYFLIGSFVFYLAYTMYATPWVALGYELTPDYHERTRLMGVQNFMGQFAYMVAPWFLFIMQYEAWFDNMVEGAAGLSIAIAVVVLAIGILPAIFLVERFKDAESNEAGSGSKLPRRKIILENIKDFLKGFATTLKFTPFLKLCAATFLVFNGFILIASFQSYVIIYYVFGGDTVEGAKFVGYSGTLGTICTFLVIMFVTWISTKIGKRHTFFLATGISVLGYGLKWFCYNPDLPWLLLLPAPLMAFGLGGLFTLMPSMIADIVDYDELQTHERREGMYGSIFWWVVKLGMAAALAAGGFLLNTTGFDVALGANQTEDAIFLMRLYDVLVPVICSLIAIWVISTYEITEEKAHVIREQLEARRGTT